MDLLNAQLAVLLAQKDLSAKQAILASLQFQAQIDKVTDSINNPSPAKVAKAAPVAPKA